MLRAWMLATILVLLPTSATLADGDKGTDAEATNNSFIVATQRRDAEQRRILEALTDDPKQYTTVPSCGLGGRDTCHHRSRCENGEEMVDVYVVEDGVRVGGPFPVCPEEASPHREAQITAGMVLRALRRVTLPKPKLSIQPPGGKTLVNFETIFSTDADSFRRTVRLLGRRVQLDITPTAYVWSYGDGTSETTTESGVPWEEGLPMSGYLTHVYEDAHVTMRPTVAVTYGARFRVDGGAWRDVAGTVTSEGAPVDLRVIEGRATLLSGY